MKLVLYRFKITNVVHCIYKFVMHLCMLLFFLLSKKIAVFIIICRLVMLIDIVTTRKCSFFSYFFLYFQ